MISNLRFIIAYILIIITGLFINLHSDITVPVNKPFEEFPVRSNGWSMISQDTFSERILEILKPTDYISRQYVDPGGNRVNLYIGYHGGGKGSGEIHSPKQCLPGSGWYKILEREMNTEAGGKAINLVKAIYQKEDGKEMFLYWYQIKGKSITSEYTLKISSILNSIFYRRKDSAFIRIAVPFESDEGKAFSAGELFIKDFYPIIETFLPK